MSPGTISLGIVQRISHLKSAVGVHERDSPIDLQYCECKHCHNVIDVF